MPRSLMSRPGIFAGHLALPLAGHCAERTQPASTIPIGDGQTSESEHSGLGLFAMMSSDADVRLVNEALEMTRMPAKRVRKWGLKNCARVHGPAQQARQV